jgi:hypothetical protein
MAKIFISHSSKDKPFAIEFKRRLDSRGHVVWLDTSELLVGDEIRAKIDEGIGRCDVVVFVLSPDAILSRWFNYELRVAQTPNSSGKKRPLFPVLLRECANLPPDLEGVRFADFRADYEQGWKDLEQGLSQWEQSQPPSSPPGPSSGSGQKQPPSPTAQAHRYDKLEQKLVASAPPESGSSALRDHLEAYSGRSAGTKKEKPSSISGARIATAVMLIVGGLGMAIATSDDPRPSNGSAPRRQSFLAQVADTIAPANSRSTRAVGGNATKLEELRSQNRVRPLQDNEAALSAERLPSGVFGFVGIDVLPLLRRAQIQLTPSSTGSPTTAFEIQKTSVGELLVVGYARESDFTQATTGRQMSLALAPKAGRRSRLISIPMDRIKAVTLKTDQGERVAELALGTAVSSR